jgi:two-component system response regulator ChvI
MLRSDTNRALWAGRVVDLTLTEFRIVTLLAERAGREVGYREIYDLVHGKDFVAGQGAEGYRANVSRPSTTPRCLISDVISPRSRAK